MIDFETYISSITYRYIKPDKMGIRILHHLLSTCIKDFEKKNTILPEDDLEMKKRLECISRIPRLSTFTIGAIINKAVSGMNVNHAFVNIGVWHGFTLLAGMMNNEAKLCIGVDNFLKASKIEKAFLKRFETYGSANHKFYKEDYRDYFENRHDSPIGVYMYDAAHDFQNHLLGLEMAEPYFVKDSIIIVDDTNWEAPRNATYEFLSSHPGEYRVLIDTQTACTCHLTLWCGLIVLQKIK